MAITSKKQQQQQQQQPTTIPTCSVYDGLWLEMWMRQVSQSQCSGRLRFDCKGLGAHHHGWLHCRDATGMAWKQKVSSMDQSSPVSSIWCYLMFIYIYIYVHVFLYIYIYISSNALFKHVFFFVFFFPFFFFGGGLWTLRWKVAPNASGPFPDPLLGLKPSKSGLAKPRGNQSAISCRNVWYIIIEPK